MPKLLVVEDEDSLRDLLGRYLGRSGHETEMFSSSEDALRCYEGNPQGFSLVITDLTLPVISGEELIMRMRTLNPEQRFLILSGHPYDGSAANVGFLQKPFLPKILLEAIERAIQ